MSDSARLREDAERRCGDNADTIRQLAAEIRQLKEALRIAEWDVGVLQGERDMAIASATMELATQNRKLRDALRRVLTEHDAPASDPEYWQPYADLLEAV